MGAFRSKLRDSGRTFRQVLRNRQVRRLEASWAASLIAVWAYSVAIVVYTYDQGGAELVGIALAIKIAPAALAAPLVSTLADRVSRRLVLVGSASGQALVAALIAVAISLDAPVALVIGMSAVFTVLTTALQPAVASLLPQLCEEPDELTAANVVNSTIESLAIFVGPAIGGLILGISDPQTLVLVTAGGFLASALLVARVVEPARADTPSGEATEDDGSADPQGMLADVADGFRVVRRDRDLRTVIGLMVAQTLVDGALGVLIAVAAFELLDFGEAGIGFLDSACGIGALLGSVAAAGMVGSRLAPSFSIGMALWGAPLALLALFPYPAVALVLFAVIGVGNILIDVAGYTMLQRAAPERVLARVFGVLEAAILTSIAVGGLLTPVLLNVVGTDATFVLAGLFLPVLAAATWPRLKAIDAATAVPSEALELLQALPLFSPLGPVAIEKLARNASRVTVAAGEPVFSQGDLGERFYVIAAGEAQVLVDGIEARTEGPGDHFGEIALLRDVPRTATVIARSDLDLLCLEGADFVAALSGNAEARGVADAVVGARLGHMRPSLGTP